MATPVCTATGQVQVFALPPRRTNRGYRADEWSLDQPLWSGQAKVMEGLDGGELVVRLLDDTGALFAEAPYEGPYCVEPVPDSGRFFVLRVVGAQAGQVAYLGVGFLDRDEAFDFKEALQTWQRHQQPSNTSARMDDTRYKRYKPRISHEEETQEIPLIPPPPPARGGGGDGGADFGDFVG